MSATRPPGGPAGVRGTGDVLLLHGLANTPAVWSPFARRYRGGAVHAPDLPWASDGRPGWSYRIDLPGHLAALIERTALSGRTTADGGLTVVAHSFSANLLLQLLDRELRGADGWGAIRRLRGIVLVSPFYRSDLAQFTWRDLQHYLGGFERIMAHGVEVQAGGRLGEDLCLELGRRVRDFVGPHGWMRFFESYLATPWLRLSGMPVPCLIVAGADDPAAHPAEAIALAGHLPRAVTRVLPGCGHFPMSERPDEFTDAVTGFLRGLRPAPAVAATPVP